MIKVSSLSIKNIDHFTIKLLSNVVIDQFSFELMPNSSASKICCLSHYILLLVNDARG